MTIIQRICSMHRRVSVEDATILSVICSGLTMLTFLFTIWLLSLVSR